MPSNKSIAIIGCGAMGGSIASLLSLKEGIDKLILCDIKEDILESTMSKIKKISKVDILTCNDIAQNECLLADADAFVLSMPWPLVWRSIQVLAEQKKPIVSITRPHYSFWNVLQNFSSCPLALPIGLEPGLTEIIIEHSIKQLGKIDRLSLYCGGFMDPPPTHFPYRCAFGDSVPISANKAFFIERNTVKTASKYDNVEEIFIQDLGFFEAYRDGLIPCIADSYKHLVTYLEQKTLRHRGFCSQVRNLEKMGFLSEKSININGHDVDILSFSRRILALESENFPEVSSDKTLLKVIAEARGENKSLTITANYCSQYCLPSMGIMTASVLTHYLLEFVNHIGMENRYYAPHEYYSDDNARQSLFTYMKSLGILFQGNLIS